MANPFRKMLADELIRNGGYSRHYESYPIEYGVGLWHADLSLDHIYEVMCKVHGYLPPPTDIEWDENDEWTWAQEGMASGLNDCNDGYRTYSPETAKRFGLPHDRFPRKYKRRTNESCYYPTSKSGWILESPYIGLYFDVKFGLAGRGGKHLVIEEFEGHKLNMSSKELAEAILDPDLYYGASNYSNEWCRNLLAMMSEWEKFFTPKIASEELEYQAAWSLYQKLEKKADAWRAHLKERRAEHALFKFGRNLTSVAAQHPWSPL